MRTSRRGRKRSNVIKRTMMAQRGAGAESNIRTKRAARGRGAERPIRARRELRTKRAVRKVRTFTCKRAVSNENDENDEQ